MSKNEVKSKSPKAYQHYLQTGTVFGYHEGARIEGKGPPENPMSPEVFDKMAASLPKPAHKPRRLGPEAIHIIERDRDPLQWAAWMEALFENDRRRAEQVGAIATSALWPANGRIIHIERSYKDLTKRITGERD